MRPRRTTSWKFRPAVLGRSGSRRIMKSSGKLIIGIAAFAYLGVSSLMVVRIGAQTRMPTPMPGVKAGDAFKNVTTSTLKELSVDDFVASMGVIAAGLGLDCADC